MSFSLLEKLHRRSVGKRDELNKPSLAERGRPRLQQCLPSLSRRLVPTRPIFCCIAAAGEGRTPLAAALVVNRSQPQERTTPIVPRWSFERQNRHDRSRTLRQFRLWIFEGRIDCAH